MATDYSMQSTSLKPMRAVDVIPPQRRVSFLQSLCYEDSVSSVLSLLNNNLWSQKSFRKYCERWLQERYGGGVWLTSSCSQAFYLAAVLMDLAPGDEVILPSYTHPSTANAFAAAGASLVFVDISPGQMTLDTEQVARAVSARTRAIVAVHYGGFSADMHHLVEIAARQPSCLLIEDAAHALLATQNGQLLGTFGQLSCLSFEQQKNISCGEGGALLIADPDRFPAVELVYEAGTNKAAYLRAEASSYSWQCAGAKYAPSELTLAQLWAGFRTADQLLDKRKALWEMYHQQLQALDLSEVSLPQPSDPGHNAHLYYLLLSTRSECLDLQRYLQSAEIETHTHYVPLHNSPYGRGFRFFNQDIYTTSCSQRLLRLPLHADMSAEDISYVVQAVATFFYR